MAKDELVGSAGETGVHEVAFCRVGGTRGEQGGGRTMLLYPASGKHQVGGHLPEALSLSFSKAATSLYGSIPVCSSRKSIGFKFQLGVPSSALHLPNR